MSKRNVTVTYWSHKRQWRVRCFQPAESGDWNGFGRVLAESFHRQESAARKTAKQLAADYGAELEV